jgi:DNA-binding protein HU-beta
MTKADIVKELSNKTGIESTEVSVVLESFIQVIKTSMENGNEIFIRGFGSFIIKKRAQKVGRDLSKNTAIIIPEHYIPKFKPSQEFTEMVKNGKMKIDHKTKA